MDLEISLAVQKVIKEQLKCFVNKDLSLLIHTQLQIVKLVDCQFYEYVLENIKGKSISKMKKSELQEVLSSILTHRLSDCYFTE
jgi:hypothetical protein